MTQAETIFLNRMVPHMVAGKTFEDAARAVLADDERIWLKATAKDQVGDAVRQEMATAVYAKLRAA